MESKAWCEAMFDENKTVSQENLFDNVTFSQTFYGFSFSNRTFCAVKNEIFALLGGTFIQEGGV